MITAENVTDSQIRSLMTCAEAKGWHSTISVCRLALDSTNVYISRVRDARRRCAEILRMGWA